MWEELHMAAVLAKGVYKNAEVVPAPQALAFATCQGATALGASHFGALQPGKRADIVVVELDGLHLTPRYPHAGAVTSHLVYSAQAADVRDTIIHGQVLLRERRLTRLDEAELKAKARAWVASNF
jgi:5-methylthioadenosine/S-adenosylhomocysteine deaminase